jgi:hypothetical protein
MSDDLPTTLDELAAVAVTEHEAFERETASALAHAIRAGEALIAAKAQLNHGEWLPWIAESFPASERTARRYMTLAANRTRVTDLDSVRAGLAELAEPREPEPFRQPEPESEDESEEEEPSREPRPLLGWPPRTLLRDAVYNGFRAYSQLEDSTPPDEEARGECLRLIAKLRRYTDAIEAMLTDGELDAELREALGGIEP